MLQPPIGIAGAAKQSYWRPFVLSVTSTLVRVNRQSEADLGTRMQHWSGDFTVQVEINLLPVTKGRLKAWVTRSGL